MRPFLLAAALLLASPVLSLAGWFGIGEAAAAISDATWKVVAVRAIERVMPSLILLACIVGAIVCALVVGRIAGGFSDSVRSILRDDKITMGEGILLTGYGAITFAVILALGWFGLFLMNASRAGLLEGMR